MMTRLRRLPNVDLLAFEELFRCIPLKKLFARFHESWDLCNSERGVAGTAGDFQFEDVARGEKQIGPDGYRMDYERWREAFPDGEVKVTNVIVDGDRAVVEFHNRGTQTGPLRSSLGTFKPSGRR